MSIAFMWADDRPQAKTESFIEMENMADSEESQSSASSPRSLGSGWRDMAQAHRDKLE